MSPPLFCHLCSWWHVSALQETHEPVQMDECRECLWADSLGEVTRESIQAILDDTDPGAPR